jgi:hypothetical protein
MSVASWGIDLKALLDVHDDPCITVYLPTGWSRGDTRLGVIHLRDLITRAERHLLLQGRPRAQVTKLLSPLATLLDDDMLWTRDVSRGLALFRAPRVFERCHIAQDLRPEAHVAHRFHFRPILPLLAGAMDFDLLLVDPARPRLFRCTRHSISERTHPALGTVGIAAGEVAASLRARLGDLLPEAGRPLLLAGTAPNREAFRAAAGPALPHCTFELDDPLLRLSEEAILDRALRAMEGHATACREEDLRTLSDPSARTTSDLGEVLTAAHRGKVECILISEEAEPRGRWEPHSGRVLVNAHPGPGDLDLLEEAAVYTLRHGGRLHMAHADEMPACCAGSQVLARLRP